MLIPLLLVLGMNQPREPGDGPRHRIPVPWFVIGFLAVLMFNSAVTVHPQVRASILLGDQFLFLMVTIALGLTTSLVKLREGSDTLRLIGAGCFALLLSAAVAYGFVAAVSGWTAKPVDTELAEAGGVLPAGARLFDSVGCEKCHVRSLHGSQGDVLLYSDLLLHDMGPGLDDKIVQGDATGADWRTTPLVGLRMRERFLHDGRASTLRAAVLDHGGEAEIVRDRFFRLDEAQQQEVFRFLASL
jgi:hypothetical protein